MLALELDGLLVQEKSEVNRENSSSCCVLGDLEIRKLEIV